MDNDNTIERFLKIIGIAALVAVPVFFLVRKFRDNKIVTPQRDDTDIFAEEFSE